MKKSLTAINKISALFALFLFSSLLGSLTECRAQPAVFERPAEMKAVVIKTAGDVRIRSRGSIVWHDAKTNEVLGTGDQIETRENGKVEIRLENRNVLNLKPNSKLILQKLSRDSMSGDYENLLESGIGKIRAKVEKITGNSKFEIKTPTAVAAVRGTTMYLDIMPDITNAFFEGGFGALTNTLSNEMKTVGDGQASSSDDQGNVSEPEETSDRERSEWREGWQDEAGAEGYTEPESDGKSGISDEVARQNEERENSNQEALEDRHISREAELPAFEGSPPTVSSAEITPQTEIVSNPETTPPADGTAETDTDSDGIPDSTDTDDDNDVMTDAYEVESDLNTLVNDAELDKDGDNLTNLREFDLETYADNPDSDGDGLNDGNEVDRWKTDPLAFDADRDADHIPDIEDAFADDADLDAVNPDIYGSRDRVRNELKNIMESELEILRKELSAMIEDTQIRRMDADMTRVADAQTGKVLTDREGNRVRVEQYVLRPTSDSVEVLNVNLRTAGDFAGLSTLDWKTRFEGQNLDGLTGAQLRQLPWNDYLEAPATGSDLAGWGPEYASAPHYFPTLMSIELKNPGGNSFYEERALTGPETKPLWNGKYRQNVTRDQIKVNGGELRDFTIARSFGGGTGNPNGFKYALSGGLSADRDEILFRFYVIGDGADTGRVAVSNKNFNNVWEALAVNMAGAPSRMNIGNNNLEMRISGPGYSKDIDVIYVPFSRLDWNDSHSW